MKNTRLSTPRNMSVRLRRKAARAVVAVAMAVPFLLPFAACGPTAADRALDRAEALMEERPDSAYSIIMSIDSISRQRNPKARLLESEARYMLDMNPIIPDGRTLDNIATTDDRLTEVKIYYLKGYDSYMKGNVESAVLNALYAEKAAEEGGSRISPLWKARIHQLLGMSYSLAHNLVKAAGYFDMAQKMFVQAGKKINVIYNGLDMIICLSGSKAYAVNPDSIVSLAENIYKENREFFSDLRLKNYWYYTYAGPLLESGDTVRLGRCLEFWESDSCMLSENSRLLPLKAKVMACLGRNREAESLADSLLGLNMDPSLRITAYEALATCYMKDGDIRNYIECRDSISALRDGQAAVIIGRSDLDIQNRFNEEMARTARESEHLARKKQMVWAVVCVLTIITAVLIFLIIRRRAKFRIREKVSELIVMRDDLNKIQEEVDRSRRKSESVSKAYREAKESALLERESNRQKESDYRQRIRQLEEKLNAASATTSSGGELSTLFSEQIAMANCLCEDIMDNPDSSLKSDMKRMRVISNLYENLRNPDLIRIIETRVNLTRDDLIKRLREQYSGFLSSDDIDFYILTASGMKYRTVSAIQNKSMSSYSKRKFRIKEKLKYNNPESLGEFISYL